MMIFFIIACFFTFGWEMSVFAKHKYIEDLLISVAAAGVAMFLIVLKLRGVQV